MDTKRIQRYHDKFAKFDLYYSQLTEWLESHPINILDENKSAHWIYAIIHVFQNLAELISDLGSMILKDSGVIVKDSYTNYQNLHNKSIITKSTHEILKKVNGLRNRVAHEYIGLNYNMAWEAMEEFVGKLDTIRGELHQWLSNNS